ncbi:MAG: CBS domain-containing protein [Oligoflexia bacterium]|nr:CBS domain-containing protein [Oligoflexia bacterium]
MNTNFNSKVLVKDVYNKKFKVIPPYTKVAKIEDAFSRISHMVVMEKDSYYGIISAKDIVKSPHVLVIDCLHERPKISFDSPINDVLKIFKRTGYSTLPVFNNNEFIGTISPNDYLSLFKYKETEASNNPLKTTEPNEETLSFVCKLAENVSYLILNPLTIVSGFTELILDGCKELKNSSTDLNNKKIEEIIKYAESVKDAHLKIKKIVTSLPREDHDNSSVIIKNLYFDRDIENFELCGSYKLYNPNEIIKETLERIRSVYLDEHIDINFIAHDSLELPTAVNIDKEHLRLILLYLLSNSKDSIIQQQKLQNDQEYRGEIVIESKVEDKHYHILVKDNGIGIKEAEMKYIFSPFYTTKLEESIGNGLALVYCIVKFLKGKIMVSSEYTKGATIEIKLLTSS